MHDPEIQLQALRSTRLNATEYSPRSVCLPYKRISCSRVCTHTLRSAHLPDECILYVRVHAQLGVHPGACTEEHILGIEKHRRSSTRLRKAHPMLRSAHQGQRTHDNARSGACKGPGEPAHMQVLLGLCVRLPVCTHTQDCLLSRMRMPWSACVKARTHTGCTHTERTVVHTCCMLLMCSEILLRVWSLL